MHLHIFSSTYPCKILRTNRFSLSYRKSDNEDSCHLKYLSASTVLYNSVYLFFFLQLARENLSFWVKAFSEDTAKRLENFGFIQFRPGGISSSCLYHNYILQSAVCRTILWIISNMCLPNRFMLNGWYYM